MKSALSLLPPLVIFSVACAAPRTLAKISVTPATASIAEGETVQFTAIGTFNNGGHPQTTQDITSSVKWASSETGVVTINSAGLARGVGSGTTSITATGSSSFGPVTGTAALTVQ